MKTKYVKLFESLFSEVTEASQVGLNQEVKFAFNFESGRYQASEIQPNQVEVLKSDLKPVLGELLIPKHMNGKTIIELTASTSTLRLTPQLVQKLQSEGYTGQGQNDPSGNALLCEARLTTMEKLITNILAESLKTTPQGLLTKVEFRKVLKPNQGSGNTPEERKQWQYISMKLVQTGTPIPEAIKVPCGLRDRLFNGKMGTSETNYAGYSADLVLTIPAGNTITISFNSLHIPDMFYVKYKDVEFLSAFQGSAALASKLSAVPDLEEKINAELRALGSAKTVRELQPNAINQDGTWNVVKGQYQRAEEGAYAVTVTKGWENDSFKIRVFSPLEATRFSISTTCSENAPNLLTQKGKV